MSVRQMALATSGAVVLAASLYLFVKVRAAPATPSQQAIDEAKARAPVAPPPPPSAGTDLWAAGAIGSPQARAEATRTQLVGPGDTRVEPPPAGSGTEPALQADPQNVDDDLKASDGQTVANKMFDRGDYDDAMKQALKMLDTDPKNSRMLRIVVSSACFMGDPDKAQKYWALLSDDRDRAQMAVRCGRYGITFKQ